jgi:hypothetical protein
MRNDNTMLAKPFLKGLSMCGGDTRLILSVYSTAAYHHQARGVNFTENNLAASAHQLPFSSPELLALRSAERDFTQRGRANF